MTYLSPFGLEPESVGVEEVLTDADRIDAAYARFEIDELLHKYAEGHDWELTNDIEAALVGLGYAIGNIAYKGGNVDIGLVRRGFELMYDTMDAALAQKEGIKPPSVARKVLERWGLRYPDYVPTFSRLDDRYWDKQFMEEFNKDTWIKRLPTETNQEYFNRYVGWALHSFPWAYYSYI